MLSKVEKNIVSEICFDSIAEVLRFDFGSLQYIDIFEYVKKHTRYASYSDQLSDGDLSAIIDRHLNSLIADRLVEISTDRELKVLFSYIVY